MRVGVVGGLDLVAVLAAAIAAAMSWVYVEVIHGQGGEPLAWVLAVLLTGASVVLLCAPLRTPYRRIGLVVAGTGLTLLGVLAILSIGLPIFLAGMLALGSALRRGGAVSSGRRAPARAGAAPARASGADPGARRTPP